MRPERTCPHCGNQAPTDRIICPHCNQTLPSVSAPAYQSPGVPPPPGGPAYAAPQPPTLQGAYRPPTDYPLPGYTPPPPPPDDSLGLIGLVLGILGIVCCGCLSVLAPVGLILCLIAHNRRPTGTTTAGIAVGIIGTLLFILSMVWMVYSAMHPELQNEMLRMMEDSGFRFPPGFPIQPGGG